MRSKLMQVLFPLAPLAALSGVNALSQGVSVPREPGRVCVDNVCTASSDYHPAGYSLTFADEFEGTELDRTKWCTKFIWGGGGSSPQTPDAFCQQNGQGTLDFVNDEQQRYVDYNARGVAMHVVADSVLTLQATKTRSNKYDAYESGMVRSKALFRPTTTTSYYITSRVKLPNVRGSWPSFWLNSDWTTDGKTSWPPEIDIFEAALNEKDDTASMLHQGAIVKGGKQTATGKTDLQFKLSNFDAEWNNFKATNSLRDRWIEIGAEWTHQQVCYFIDGLKTMCERYKWIYDTGTPAAAAHIIMNLAIGGGWAGRYGIADDKFPVRLQVDYIRVYVK